jgi:hypothetical protein
MYNTQFRCTYKNVVDEVQQEDQYRTEFLRAFNLEEFDEAIINKDVDVLFESLKKSPIFVECMEKSALTFFSDDLQIGLMGMFAFDFFYLAHPCICEFLENNTINEENINALLCAV